MDELIFNQKKIPKKQWRYGLRSSAATGCGWIAVYNALQLMGLRTRPEALIRWFTRDVPLLNGNAGTMIFSPMRCLRRMGFRVRAVLRPSRFDGAAKEADVCLLYYRWRHKWKCGAHFVALQYRNGAFWGYNTYTNSTGPDYYGDSLEGYLRRERYRIPVLFSVHRK